MTTTFQWDSATPPISFVYDGRPSVDLLLNWEPDESSDTTSDAHRRRVQYTDPETGLHISADIRTFPDSPAVEWVLEFGNNGSEPTPILERVLPLDVVLPQTADAQVILHAANGSKCVLDDFLPRTIELEAGQPIELAPIGGRSSDGVLPFMNLQWPGGGCVVAIGWSGQWSSSWERSAAGVRVTGGMERTHLRLEPGERIRTPRILVVPWDGDDANQGNILLRRLLLAHYCPRIQSELVIPPVAHMTMSTFHKTGQTDEQAELTALHKAKTLGVEAFWVDACWYGGEGKWYEEVGSWTVRRDSFPRGLKPIGDAAHDAGMRFVLWVEPERVRKNTLIAREHPEFLLGASEADTEWVFNSAENALFNLGLPEARAFMTEVLSDLIATSGVDIYRQDFNFQPLPYWRAADAPDRIGMTEIRHIEGLYAMWDELRQRHPGLAIDNCASGGRRIDLETTMRSFPLWRSDFSDVGGPEHGARLQIGDQSQTAGLSRWIPLHTAAVWSFTPYAFRSAMSSGVVLYCDIRPDSFPAEDARRAIAELKRLRPYTLGDFYPLVPLTVDDTDWCAYQFHRPNTGDGYAVFLRRHASEAGSLAVTLTGIDRDAEYDVGMAETFDAPPRTRMPGAQLAQVTISIAEQPGSLLLEYHRADTQPASPPPA